MLQADFTRRVRACERRLYRVARTLLPRECDCEDAVQEALLRCLSYIAANWQPGDPDITVWATKGGTYYHLDEHCSGMHSAVHWDISKAVEDGKKPCPVCAGGEPGPVQLEEGEDISCFQDG